MLIQDDRKKLLIVGCGASAVILLAEISESAEDSFDIYLCDDNPEAPKGIAYAVNHPNFVLNVPVIKMGATLSNQDGFYTWLRENRSLWSMLHPDLENLVYGPNDFAPRMLYAEYLKSVFIRAKEKLRAKGFVIVEYVERVEKVESIDGVIGVDLVCRKLVADAVVFCSGHRSKRGIISHGLGAHFSPYAQYFLTDDWSDYRNIIIVGSGLSSIDFIRYSEASGFKGKYHIISKSGLFPLPHASSAGKPKPIELDDRLLNLSPYKLLKELRKYVADNQRLGISWQDSLNSIRENANKIFSSIPESKKTDFVS